MKRRRKNNADGGLMLLYTLRSALLACIATAALALLAAFFLKWEWVSVEQLHLVNTIIKTLSACLAGFLLMRMSGGKGLLYAGLAGLLYIALSYVVFLLIEQEFSVKWTALWDVVLCVVAALSAALIRNTLQPSES